jgi:DNA-binding response OmpR family regulator
VGYEVADACNAEDALGEANRLDRLDLLITDVVLPGVNGKELAGRLVTSQPDATVLYMTGYADHAETGDISPVLRKPFSPDELVRTVRTLLSERRGRGDG